LCHKAWIHRRFYHKPSTCTTNLEQYRASTIKLEHTKAFAIDLLHAPQILNIVKLPP
jgi:hypothetical protein